MSYYNNKTPWSGLRALAEFTLGTVSLFFAISFFTSVERSELTAIKAFGVFIFLMVVILYFLSHGFYYLFEFLGFLREKYTYDFPSKYGRIKWRSIGGVALGMFLLTVGLMVVYSSIADFYHYFNCEFYTSSSYWKAVTLSISPVCGCGVGCTIVYLGGLMVVKRDCDI